VFSVWQVLIFFKFVSFFSGRGVVNMVMNFRLPLNSENLLADWWILASQKDLTSVELVNDFFLTRYIIYKKHDNFVKGTVMKSMQILNGLYLKTWLFNRKNNKLTHWFYNALLDSRIPAYNVQVLMAFLFKWTLLCLEV
jgi:hypothetical protein